MMWKSFDYKRRFFVVFLRREKQKKGGAPVQEKDEQ